MMGSPTVKINGKTAARHGDTAQTCNDPGGPAGRAGHRRRHGAHRLMDGADLGATFLGVGWELPRRPGRTTGRSRSRGTRRASASRSGSSSAPRQGERVMRPDFGCGIHDLVFAHEQRGHDRRLVADEVRDGAGPLGAAHRRARRRRSARRPARGDDAARSRIDYRVRATNNVFNLVYPFYLERAPF